MNLLAFRFSGDIEARLSALQRDLFAEHGYVSARLLPPLIPLALTTATPHEHLLDRVRRRIPLEVAIEPAGRRRTLPSAGVPLAATSHGDGGDLLAAFSAAAEELELTACCRALRSPYIALAWEGSLAVDCADLPSTGALWLSAIEIDRGAHPLAWWEGARWWEHYRRRITVVKR